MKLRRLITRRRAKWVGAVLCLLLAAVFVLSRWMYVTVQTWSAQGVGLNATVWAGRIECREVRSTPVVLPRFPISDPVLPQRQTSFESGVADEPRLNLWLDWDRYSMRHGPHVRFLRLPLWMPLLVLAIPTAWLWRSDRRIQRWQCAKCRYDLRGLERGRDGGGDGAVCPECGSVRA